MVVLAEGLEYFTDVDNEEVLRLFEQAKAIHARVYGSSSVTVAVCEGKMGANYIRRGVRAEGAKDIDRYVANLELALPRCREEARIYRAIGHVDNADKAAQGVIDVEKALHQASIDRSRLRASQG